MRAPTRMAIVDVKGKVVDAALPPGLKVFFFFHLLKKFI